MNLPFSKRLRRPVFGSPHPLDRRYQGQHPVKTLAYIYSRDRGKLAMALGFYIVKHSPVWIMPLLTAHIVNIISQPERHAPSELWMTGGVLAVVILQNVLTHYLYIRYLSIAIRQMETNLRSTICRRLQQLSIGFYSRSSTGALQAKVLRDVEVIEQLTRVLCQGLPSAILTMVVALVVTGLRAPWFLLFFLFVVPVAAFLVRSLRESLKEGNSAYRQEVESMSSRVSEMIQLIPVTRAHGAEREELRKVNRRLVEVRDAGFRLDGVNAIFGASSWVTFNLFNVLCLVTAAWLYYQGIIPITVGDVVLLTGYFNTLTGSVMEIANTMPQISKGFESIRSVGEILECPDLELNEGKRPVAALQGRFAFEDVHFAYPDASEASLAELSLTVEPGETIAVVGSSGAGKSTLLNLLIGFLRPSGGRILLDGQDMNTLDLRTYRRFVSVVSQETLLFDGTIRENILYGSSKVDQARLERAIADANAREFIERLPQGLDTRIGERGARLSGGQKQRLAIARALLRDPRVLILDEATSALDSVSEAQIQQALDRLRAGRTTFVVAHRLSTIRGASRIVVMEQGRPVELGTHEQLLRLGGVYARLHALQA